MDIDIEKAKQVTIKLLKKDIKIYNKFIPLIEKMDNVSFENLFFGNKDYDYNIKSFQFKLLLSKFNNYRFILTEWYESEEKFENLKQLWLRNISFESLSDKDNNQIEEFLENQKINIKNWKDDGIKNELFEVIRQIKDTEYKKVENYFKNMPEEMKIFLSYDKGCSEELKKKGAKEIGEKVLRVGLFVVQEVLNVGTDLLPLIKGLFKKHINIPLNEAKSHITNNFSNFKSHIMSQLKDVKFQAFTLITSLINVGVSISDFTEVTKLMEKVKDEKFSEKIEEIKKSFYTHKNNFLKDLDNADIVNYETIISNYNIHFKNDFQNLNVLIACIQKYIEKVNEMKGISAGKVVFGIFKFILCFVAFILTEGIGLPLLYGSCALLNEFATILHGVDIARLKELYKDLDGYLKDAEDTKKIFLNEIKKINEMLKENEEATPVYWTNEVKYYKKISENDEAAPPIK